MADQATAPQLLSQSPPTATGSRTEPLAIVSLVLAILSWVVCLFLGSIPAIICGHLARSKIRRSNGALRGMEIALGEAKSGVARGHEQFSQRKIKGIQYY